MNEPTPPPSSTPPAPSPPDDRFTDVVERHAGRRVQDIVSAGHTLVADEPTALGGDELGPTPYGLLAAALGACTSMTIRMYAERRQIPLRGVRVRVRHDKVHAQDCATCETAPAKIDRFDREIELRGELSDEQVARLLEIADKCPVHRTLHGEVEIRSTVHKVP